MYTVVVENTKGSELGFGFWYQPMRLAGGRVMEHKPYASILEQ